MNATCKKCGAPISENASSCPNCKTLDPLGRITDEAERFREEQVESAGEPAKK